MISRRQFLQAAAGFPAILHAAEYDLVIRGGRVLDPSQNLDRTLDVAIRDGKIAALGSNLNAPQFIDARGKLVVPGLIDVHVHAPMPRSRRLSSSRSE